MIHVFSFSEFSINSTILHGNQYYLRHLHRFLANAPEVGKDSSWFLCYNATSHGWKAKTFHDRCDGKENTVTIVQKGQYVFGGYTDIRWGKIWYWFLSTFKRALVPRVFHWHRKILLNDELFPRDICLDTPFTLYLSSLRFSRSNELNSDNIQDFFLAKELSYL